MLPQEGALHGGHVEAGSPGNHHGVRREKMFGGMTEAGEGAFANQLGVEDFGHQQVGSLLWDGAKYNGGTIIQVGTLF